MPHLKTHALLPLLAAGLLTLAGCANTSTYSGDVYRGNQAQTAQTVSYGTITALAPGTDSSKRPEQRCAWRHWRRRDRWSTG